MRVAYVCADPGVPVFGTKGCSIHVQSILREMVRRGFSVDLYAARTEGCAPEGLDSVRINRLIIPRSAQDVDRERALISINRPLRIQLETQGPYDMIYERHALWCSAAQQYANESQTPSILEVNAPLLVEQATHRELQQTLLAAETVKNAFQNATVRLAVSKAVAEHVAEISGSSDRILVQPNGVDVQRFAPSRRVVTQRWNARAQGFRRDPFVIGFIGTLRPWHGMSALGAAFRRLHERKPQTRLLIIGDGPATEELFSALGPAVEATEVTGKMSHDAVPALLGRCDIGVAPYPPSADFYFSPLKVFEYMASGLPIVASRVGAIAECLVDSETARLVEPGDVNAIADTIGAVIEDPGQALALGAAAAATAARNHTWTQVLDRALGSLPEVDDIPARIA